MKALLFAVFALAGVNIAVGQTPTPYYTGFDNSAQQAGWQKFRQGTLHIYQWETGPATGPYSPPYCAWHNYPTGGVGVPVVDWFVSPMFNFTGGGQIDSIKVNVHSPSAVATLNDSFKIYLLTGSPNPAQATGISLLADFTSLVSISQNYKDTFHIPIPPTGGNCYIGFKYSGTGQSNFFTCRFDNLKISSGTGCAPPTNVTATPTASAVNITWTAPAGVPGYNYVLDSQPNDPAVQGNSTTGTGFSTMGLSHSTTYYFHLRSACGGNFNSGWINTPFTTLTPGTPCAQPAGIEVNNISDTGAKLSWQAVGGSKGYEYMVTEDPMFPTNSGYTANVLYAEAGGLKPGTVYYAYLRTRCEGTSGFIFSPWIGKQFFTQFPASVHTATGAEIRLYPNPVKDMLVLEGAAGKGTITIHSISGQVIETITANQSTVHIDMSTYPKGVFIVQYVSGEKRFRAVVSKQ